MTSVSHDSETPANGQQVITACAFIQHQFEGIEKVFLPRRAATEKFLPGVFELPGGHINFGEQVEVGLQREIFEEFGMQIEVGEPFYVFTYLNPVEGSHSIEVIYFAKFLDPLDQINLHPEDHSEFVWMGENEMDLILSSHKNADGPELKAITKGFKLLKN